MKHLFLLTTLFSLIFALSIGELPKPINLEGDNGSLVTGEAFNSDIIKDRVYVLFYVDPDEKEMNEHVSAALKAEQFDREHYGSIAIINMAATWLPNFAIASQLKKKQEEFPNTIYAKDLKSVLINEWELEDDSSNVLLFDKEGRLLFIKKGKLSDGDTKAHISLIKAHI